MQIDHVVLWVEEPLRSVEFFEKVVGLKAERVDEWQQKRAIGPSIRVSEHSIIDLVPRAAAAAVNAIPGVAGTAGHLTNHVCLAMTEAEMEALAERLAANGTPATHHAPQRSGARGVAPKTFYFRDPDGNVFEARFY